MSIRDEKISFLRAPFRLRFRTDIGEDKAWLMTHNGQRSGGWGCDDATCSLKGILRRCGHAKHPVRMPDIKRPASQSVPCMVASNVKGPLILLVSGLRHADRMCLKKSD